MSMGGGWNSHQNPPSRIIDVMNRYSRPIGYCYKASHASQSDTDSDFRMIGSLFSVFLLLSLHFFMYLFFFLSSPFYSDLVLPFPFPPLLQCQSFISPARLHYNPSNLAQFVTKTPFGRHKQNKRRAVINWILRCSVILKSNMRDLQMEHGNGVKSAHRKRRRFRY